MLSVVLPCYRLSRLYSSFTGQYGNVMFWVTRTNLAYANLVRTKCIYYVMDYVIVSILSYIKL